MTNKLLQSMLFIAVVWYLWWEYMSTGRHLVKNYTTPRPAYSSSVEIPMVGNW